MKSGQEEYDFYSDNPGTINGKIYALIWYLALLTEPYVFPLFLECHTIYVALTKYKLNF